MQAPHFPIFVVEDDAIVRDWVRRALEPSHFAIAGEASTAREGLRLTERRAASLILVDYHLPDALGTDLVRRLRLRGVRTPVLLMTANAEPGLNEVARKAGTQGTVLKSGNADDLLNAMSRVLAGEDVFDYRHPRPAATRPTLTRRELDVLRLVSEGATNRAIAEALGVTDKTVKTFLARAYLKLGVGRRAEAVSVAMRLHLI